MFSWDGVCEPPLRFDVYYVTLPTSTRANEYHNDMSDYEIAPLIDPSNPGELPTVPTQNRLPFVPARARYNQFFSGSWNMFNSLETIGHDILLASETISKRISATRLILCVQIVVRKGRAGGLHEYSQTVVRSGIGSKFRECFPLVFTHSNQS